MLILRVLLVWAALAVTAVACSRPPADPPDKQPEPRSAQDGSGGYPTARQLSLVALLATPERFQGQLVGVKGWFRDEFEGTALYLSRESYEHQLPNSVAVDIPREWPDRASLTDNYCIVEGIVEVHGDEVWMRRVRRLEVWSPASDRHPKPFAQPEPSAR